MNALMNAFIAYDSIATDIRVCQIESVRRYIHVYLGNGAR